MTALTDADQDAGLVDEPPLHSFCINPVGGQNIRAEGTYRFTTKAEAFAYAEWARSTIATLRARATAAEDKLRDREAEIERLRNVLTKVSYALMSADGFIADVVEDQITDDGQRTHTIVAAAFKEARAALASPEQPASSEEAV